ncbi:hypothetical protein SGUI_1107 [Serinicoccus hydrothermalis]|uniref:Uncharacterized protein n=1 Tax=Serinicoccus hydrothermalis TaxID=1758689 RepID=A0A1B1NAP7_9MICO|nr:hypothetical protein [Serinicoccus hydrothermalis]ANS78503.1 hypothetical protein SGUI_1107 [Serinicoccus hydrothermalis]
MGELREHWVNLRTATPSHRRVRLLAVLGALGFALSQAAAGGGGPVAWVGAVVLGLLVVVQPNGIMPALFLVWAIASWWAGVEGPWHWALLPATWSLLLVHASAALAASVPPQASVPASVLRRYAVHTGVVALVSTVVWALAALVTTGGDGGGPLPAVLGLALLALALVGYVRVRERQRQQA